MNAAVRRNARVAGLFYLLLTIVAPLRLLYIPSRIIVSGDATATANNIASHEMLFRFGMVSELTAGVFALFLTLALYRLFESVDRMLAVLVVILGGIIPATIDFLIVLNDAAALMLATGGAGYLSAIGEAQRDAMAMMFLRLHGQQVLAAEILWGLWLFPLALLILRSGFLPRFLGYWLIVNGIAYIVASLTGLLAPQYERTVSNVAFPALLGEVATMLWLVIKGAKTPAAGPA